jgi:hypothetical protein
MAQIFWRVGGPGTASVTANGGLSSAIVGVSGAPVVGANPARQSIRFANVGSSNLFVFPVTNAAGAPNTPSNANPAGSFVITPGTTFTVGGECQGAWGSFAANASSPLTILQSNI